MSQVGDSTGRTVAVRRRAGMGDVLLGTTAAWRFALATGRTLRLDWRHSRYTTDPSTNLFTEVFEPIERWGGVPVWLPTAGDALDEYLPLSAADEQASGFHACELVENGRDIPDDHVVLRGCVAPAHPGRKVMGGLLRELQLQPHLAAAVETARGQLLGDGSSIGVHIRHGNGGDIMAHTAHWRDGLAVHRVVQAIRRARDVLGPEVPVLLATDAVEIRDALCAMVPGVRTIEKRFRPQGAGELHRWADAPSTLADAVVEMWLLAHTTVLVRMPPRSYFSAPAAFIKPPAPQDLLLRGPKALQPALW